MAELSRRALLAGLGALGTAAGASAASAQPLATVAPGRFSSVLVDIQPLRARGAGPLGELLGAALLQETRRAFADRLGGPGPRLVVRITSLWLNPYTGHGSGHGRFGGGGGSETDYLDGEALIVGRRGEIIARYPQLSALPASSGGAWYDPESERRRVVALAQHYGWWLRRTIPG
jgi:hypothetical protein